MRRIKRDQKENEENAMEKDFKVNTFLKKNIIIIIIAVIVIIIINIIIINNP